MNVVIADDNVVALKLLQNALTQSGHEVRAVTNGQEA
jgi:CheY-like chemotaxis protein